MLALAMLDGKIDFQNAHAMNRMNDPVVLEMKRRISLVSDTELTKKLPAVRAAIVELTMADGGHFQTYVDRLPGAPYNPLTGAEAESKFRSLSVPVLGPEKTESILEWLRSLEHQTHISDLCRFVQVPNH
jgi:2-methylcitrate dehydratase PrpD